jgi:polyisoprenoid-binding protein YceI
MYLQKVRPILGFFGRGALFLLLALMIAACFGSSDESTPVPTATPAPTQAPTATAAPTAASAPAAASSGTTTATKSTASADPAKAAAAPVVLQIDPSQSEARFIVDEVLFGNPNTVTGRTNSVSGQINIDMADPAKTTVGPIQVDARTLATDNRFRNRSISRFILQSNKDEFQYITFTPTSITGLPSAAKAGDNLTFQIAGDLQIRDTVKPVTFDVTVKADSPTQISGLAKATVQRSDFGLEIPKVQGVADVTEQVQLELQFLAKAAQ